MCLARNAEFVAEATTVRGRFVTNLILQLCILTLKQWFLIVFLCKQSTSLAGSRSRN